MMEMEKEEWYKEKGEEKPQEAAAKVMAGGASEKMAIQQMLKTITITHYNMQLFELYQVV